MVSNDPGLKTVAASSQESLVLLRDEGYFLRLLLKVSKNTQENQKPYPVTHIVTLSPMGTDCNTEEFSSLLHNAERPSYIFSH